MGKEVNLAKQFLIRNKDNREILSFSAEVHIRNLLIELDKFYVPHIERYYNATTKTVNPPFKCRSGD